MIKQKFLGLLILGVLTAGFASLVSAAPFVSAAPATPTCGKPFLTLPPWYRGLTDADCNISVEAMNATPQPGEKKQSANLRVFIQVLALNVVEILMQIVAYVCVTFIIIGGFKYITSAGSPDGNSSGRQTIQNALIGLVISMVSVGIINFVAGGLI